MKNPVLCAIFLALLFLSACSAAGTQDVSGSGTGTGTEPAASSSPPPSSSFSSEEADTPGPSGTDLPEETTSETETGYVSPYKTREISRDGDYKTMEMYVLGSDGAYSRRITFELPVDWRGDSSVFANDEDWVYTMKVDMGSVADATRESVLADFNNRDSDEWVVVTLEENIYSTDNFEIFHYKYNSGGDAFCGNIYYLYANGERFFVSSYVFHETHPDNDTIFNRIVESVRFQF